jgi:hypothetical protein
VVGGVLAGASGFAFLHVTLDAKTGLFGADVDAMQGCFLVLQDKIVGFAEIAGHRHVGFCAFQVRGDRSEG